MENKENRKSAAEKIAGSLSDKQIDLLLDEIATGKKHSEVLSQDQIDELLKSIESDENDFTPIRKTRKIKIYDFKRPDVFSKQELRDISVVSETIARAIKRFLNSEYDINANVHIMSVDQLTYEEFARAMPIPSPCITFDWAEGAGVLQMDPGTFFGCILNSKLKKNHDPNGLEQQIFAQFLYKPFMEIVSDEFSTASGKELPDITNQKYDSNFFISNTSISRTEMGVDITFIMKNGKDEGAFNLFFNADFFKSLRKTNFFSTSNGPDYVPLAHRLPNTIVEIGRFRLEDGDELKENKIYETDNLAGDELDIYKDDKYVGSGEAVVIDNDISAIRVVTKQDEIEERIDDGFYNIKVVFGSRIVKDDYKFDEGCILELTECVNEPLKIIKANEVIGYGEIVILDESFAIKVTKVL